MSRQQIDGLTDYDYGQLGKESDIRPPRTAKATEAAEDAMNAMLRIILTHKKEMQKLPQFSSLPSANAWLNKHPNSGLRAALKDLDNDGTHEIVLYNKAGQPVIVNGYKLRPSDYATRNHYWGSHPEEKDRIEETYREWVRDKVYDVKVDPKNVWKRTVERTPYGDQLKEWGYRMPAAPKKRESPYSIFCKLIKPLVNNVFENEEFPSQLGAYAGVHNIKFMKKIFSPLSLYRVLYMKLVERPYFYLLTDAKRIDVDYDQFKAYMKNHKKAFYDWFAEKYLTGDRKEQLNPGLISELVIGYNIRNGKINTDGSDPDDAIVFLLGVDNFKDQQTYPLADLPVRQGNESDHNAANSKFIDFCLLDGNAEYILDALADSHHPCHRACRIALDKWKRVAQESTKTFFKHVIEYFFLNEQAHNNFVGASDAGKNPFSPDPDSAENIENDMRSRNIEPSSPLKLGRNNAPDPPQQQQQEQQPE